jgi:hypothetical protein
LVLAVVVAGGDVVDIGDVVDVGAVATWAVDSVVDVLEQPANVAAERSAVRATAAAAPEERCPAARITSEDASSGTGGSGFESG